MEVRVDAVVVVEVDAVAVEVAAVVEEVAEVHQEVDEVVEEGDEGESRNVEIRNGLGTNPVPPN